VSGKKNKKLKPETSVFETGTAIKLCPPQGGIFDVEKNEGSWVEYQPNDCYIPRPLPEPTRAQHKAVKCENKT
jgi:hypothetical protein